MKFRCLVGGGFLPAAAGQFYRAAVAARRCAEFRTDNRSEFNRRLKGELQEALVGIPVAELRDRHIEPTETMAGAGR